MNSIVLTGAVTMLCGAVLLYFMANQDKYSPSKSYVEQLKKKNQVSFRDPKLIAEHQKKLDELNAKKSI